tara:strand:+ start:352 stop:582 length:231 start_codon:yes stop_codon:yes gene_type:complete
MILDMIATYLMIGVVFIITVDWTTGYAIKRGLPVPSNADWNDSMRIIGILIWPLGLLFFIKGYIKERYFNNKNKNK